MIVRMYIDVAGSELEHRAITAAGYIASEAQLEQFRPAWKAVLNRAGATVFHANEFFPRAGRFRHLKPKLEGARHQQLARDFAIVAYTHLPNAFAYSLDCDHFADILGPVLAKVKTPHDRMPAAMMAVAAICNDAAQRCLPPRSGNQGHVFIEDGPGVGEIIEYLRWLKRIGEPWTAAFLEFSPIPKSDYAVQAADYLAYEAWQESTRVIESPERNGNWDAIERDTFKILATGPAMPPPVPGSGHIAMTYATEEHFRNCAPAFAAFIAANPQYQRPPRWHRWRRNSRLWLHRKRRAIRSFVIGKSKRLYHTMRKRTRASAAKR